MGVDDGSACRSPAAPLEAPGSGQALVAAVGFVILAGIAGFVAFVASLDRSEQRAGTAAPTRIVALTGGAQRIGDAIDLLAKGYGSRLLITGVNERTSRDEIATPQSRPAPALRLLRRSRLPGPQHHRQRHRDPALDARAPLPLAHRGDLELPHAAHPGGARPRHARGRARFPIRSSATAADPAIGGALRPCASWPSSTLKFIVGWVRTRVETRSGASSGDGSDGAAAEPRLPARVAGGAFGALRQGLPRGLCARRPPNARCFAPSSSISSSTPTSLGVDDRVHSVLPDAPQGVPAGRAGLGRVPRSGCCG